MIATDKNGFPIRAGEWVQQVIWDGGDPIPAEHLTEPRLVEDVGTAHYCIRVEGRRHWQAGTQFVKVPR